MSVPDWRAWYESVVVEIDRAEPGRIIASWMSHAGLYAHHDGTPLGSAETEGRRPGFSMDSGGWYWKIRDGLVIRDADGAERIARELGLLDSPGGRADWLGWLESLPSARRRQPTGARVRKRMSTPVITRALLVRALVLEGMTQADACRTWLRWEYELNGPLRKPSLDEAIMKGHDGLLEPEVNKLGTSIRRTWAALGIPTRD